ELETTLKQVMDAYTPDFAGGIIMDPHTGAIYAMAQEPSFDPNTYNLVTNPFVYNNILVSGRYETGCITRSNAKICNFDFKPRGVIPMQEVLNQSLNVGASFVADTMGHPTQTTYFQAYGLGEKTGIDLPDEIPGDL